MSRTRLCPSDIRRGRLAKAMQLFDMANLLRDLADASETANAYVTPCVHSGIAASDVICCVKHGEYAQGESHLEAIARLNSVDQESARLLRALLSLKTKTGYSHQLASAEDCKRAGRAAQALLEQPAGKTCDSLQETFDTRVGLHDHGEGRRVPVGGPRDGIDLFRGIKGS